MQQYGKKINLIIFLMMISPVACFAHALDYDFSQMSRTDIGLAYLKLGFDHIIPKGIDHILFVLCIYLLSPRLKSVIWQATAFTVAHSITLGLAMYGIIDPPAGLVEPVIALSIVLVAIENIITTQLHPLRIVIIFLFGLVHGMGFAGVLLDLGLPDREFVTALVAFNLGVEFGQITVILLAFILMGKWFGNRTWYRNRIVVPLSLAIAVMALYWTIERVSASLGWS